MTAFALRAGPAVAFLIVGNAAAVPSINMQQQQQHSSVATLVVAMCAAGARSWRRHDGGSQRA